MIVFSALSLADTSLDTSEAWFWIGTDWSLDIDSYERQLLLANNDLRREEQSS